MNLRIALCSAAVAVAATTSFLAWTPAQADPGAPVVVLESATASVGADLVAHGAGFAPNTLVLVELCGNEAKRGSADCDQANAVNAGVGSAGDFTAHLRVGAPPVACPCIVRMTGIGDAGSASAPVTVIGAPAGEDAGGLPALPPVVRALEVTSLTIEDTGSWSQWFGASPRRQLSLTLRNSGTVAVDSPPMVMAAGKGNDPSGSIDVPELGTLQPGESRTYDIPFELGPLAFGSYTIRGVIPGLAEPLTFAGHTSSVPWGLILIPIAVITQWLLLRGRNRLRDRLQPEAELPTATLALEAGAPHDSATQSESEVDAMHRSRVQRPEPPDLPPDESTGEVVELPAPPDRPAEEVVVAAVARSSVADDPERLVEMVTGETVEALLEAVGDRLLTRGEIWSMADAVSAEVGAETAAMVGLDDETRRSLVRQLRSAVDEALVSRPLHEDEAPVPAGSR